VSASAGRVRGETAQATDIADRKQEIPMRGHIRRRGNSGNSWELKFDVDADARNGKRRTQYQSFRGTKREAQIKLAELIAAADRGTYVEPNKISVAEFVRSRVDQWEAAGTTSARSAQRYRQLTENQIAPHLGSRVLQKLTVLDLESWHAALRNSGAAPRSIGHAHRVLGKALADAERADLVSRNVCKLQKAPRVPETQMAIVRDVPGFLAKLHDERLRTLTIVALFTGMRLGEILALRDVHVRLDSGVIEVREALEETGAHGVRFKGAKSRAGRRTITLPTIALEALREHRRELLETRMKLGLGRLRPEDLLFPNLEGRPLRPNTVSSDWDELAARIGMPEITFHSLRHSHASMLISEGVDIVTISKRLGHAKPDITLRVYAHMFTSDDSKAAMAVNTALGR
jgi:integrase